MPNANDFMPPNPMGKPSPLNKLTPEALAQLVAELFTDPEEPAMQNPCPLEQSDEDWYRALASNDAAWNKVKGPVAAAFEKVIQDALTPAEMAQSGRHDQATEKWFARRLTHMMYQPKLASGGGEETAQARRLSRLADKLTAAGGQGLPADGLAWLRMLAGKYRELTGRYYIFKMLPDSLRPRWEKARKDAIEAEDAELKRMCDLVCKGIPEWITDFVVEPLYVLVRANGTRERVVRIQNVHGVLTPVLRWPAEEFATPKAMRIWLNNNCVCANWASGERELNYLGMDVGQALSEQEVTEVPLRGSHYASGIWFFEDCAITSEGQRLFKDRNGCYWHRGKGYLPSDEDPEGQQFRQGPRSEMPGPLMHPRTEATEAEVRVMFQKFAADIHDSVGGYSGWLALGAALSFASAREIFERYTAFPSLWVYGESGHGKSSLVRWLMRLWGFKVKVGVPLPGSSQAGLRAALQQYGDMPLWLDEFQPRLEVWVTDLLKAIFDRGGSIKKTFNEVPRLIRAGVIVSGVATTTDSQLRGRYCHVQVSKEKRINFDMERFLQVEREAEQFYQIGRFVLEHRIEFARLVVDQVGCWITDPKLADCDARSRIVHGAAYGAFAALATLLQSHGADEMKAFREALRGHIERAQVDVRDQLYVTQFFQDLLSAEKANELGLTAAERRRYLKVVDKPEPYVSPVSPRQQELGVNPSWCAWRGKLLYLSVKDVVERVMAYRRKLGLTENLSRKDLQDQMKGRPYFIETTSARRVHQIRFDGGGQETAWCIDLDLHELGFQAMPDEEFEASLRKPDGNFYLSTEWQDPRKGPLFVLVDRLISRQS